MKSFLAICAFDFTIGTVMNKKPTVIIIAGPTASGKTKMSIELAKKLNGEIISADSMQIYKEMNIGTAKPTIEEMDGIKHHMLDFVSPDESFSVAKYKKMAYKCIEEILQKSKIPIVVGGTGLYIDSLIYAIEYPEVEIDYKYRKELENIINQKGLEYLYNEICKIDPQAAEKISKNDKKRIMRALEIYKTTGKTKTEQEILSRANEIPYNFKVYCIDMDREILYDRINKRVDIMIEQGLILEVENIFKKYKEFPTAMQGLGYKEVRKYLVGDISKEEMIEKLKMETRRYAKRQLTWFRKNKNIVWIKALNEITETGAS